ncbi:mur ligase middle domain protein, partial [Chlamydia psittaci 08DC60]
LYGLVMAFPLGNPI